MLSQYNNSRLWTASYLFPTHDVPVVYRLWVYCDFTTPIDMFPTCMYLIWHLRYGIWIFWNFLVYTKILKIPFYIFAHALWQFRRSTHWLGILRSLLFTGFELASSQWWVSEPKTQGGCVHLGHRDVTAKANNEARSPISSEPSTLPFLFSCARMMVILLLAYCTDSM